MSVGVSNFGGKQPNNTAYVKQFTNGSRNNMASWIYQNTQSSTYNPDAKVITPADKTVNVFIPNNLTVGGTFNNASDLRIKENIELLSDAENNESICEKIMNLDPCKFTFIADETKSLHYGFIAQEVEEILPELVSEVEINENNEIVSTSEESIDESSPIQTIKVVNYLEIIPLLLLKIQNMQKQIDQLISNK